MLPTPKKSFLVCFFLTLALFAPAKEEKNAEDKNKHKHGIKNRTFEISLANVSVAVSNDFVTAKDFFQETFVVNLDDFLNGFKFDFGAAIKPISLNFNWKDKWGFGFDFGHINVFGNLSLSRNMLNFETVENDTFGMGAAAFVDLLAVPVFFHVGDLKVKIRPSVYLPLLYTEPGITYSFNGERLSIDYDMRVYTLINLNGIQDFGDSDSPIHDELHTGTIWRILENNLGYDVSLGLEYNLSSWVDIGVDIFNIPLPFLAPKLNNYMRLQDSVYVDTGKIDLGELIDGGSIPEDAYHYPEEFEPEYGYDSDGKVLYRPFTALFYANCRPFDSYVFTLIPSVGLSYNRLYPNRFAPEGGLGIRLDLGNIFITTVGVNYTDRKWKNSVDFVLNFRVIELDIGVSVQSPNFVKSFQGAGVGVNVGVKIGF